MNLRYYFLRKTIFRLINNLLPHIYFLIFVTFVTFLFCFVFLTSFFNPNSLSGSRVRLPHVVFLVTVVTESDGGGGVSECGNAKLSLVTFYRSHSGVIQLRQKCDGQSAEIPGLPSVHCR